MEFVYDPCSLRMRDVVVVVPEPLNEGQLGIVEELTRLYRSKECDCNDKYGDLTQMIHNVVETLASGCVRSSRSRLRISGKLRLGG